MRILVVAAHPDDEILGLGGTLAKHVSQGNEVYVLMVTDGSTVQYKDRPEMLEQKKNELKQVKKVIGIKEVKFLDFHDMKLDTVPKVDLNIALTDYIREIRPTVVYTHFYGDVNSDHVACFEATMVATRPIGDCSVEKVLCYRTPSSTEWSAQTVSNVFKPNVFEDISEFLPIKLEAMRQYQSEIRDYPHPRSIKALEIEAYYWGKYVGVEAAEPFVLIREIGKSWV